LRRAGGLDHCTQKSPRRWEHYRGRDVEGVGGELLVSMLCKISRDLFARNEELKRTGRENEPQSKADDLPIRWPEHRPPKWVLE